MKIVFLACLAGGFSAGGRDRLPKHFVSAEEHQKITASYAEKNKERQLRELEGLWKALIVKNKKLSAFQKKNPDKDLLSIALREEVTGKSEDSISSNERTIINTLKPVADELIDCYRYYRQDRFEISCYYQDGIHHSGFSDSPQFEGNDLGHLKNQAERFRSDLVQLCGERAVTSIDVGFAASGWYIPED